MMRNRDHRHTFTFRRLPLLALALLAIVLLALSASRMARAQKHDTVVPKFVNARSDSTDIA